MSPLLDELSRLRLLSSEQGEVLRSAGVSSPETLLTEALRRGWLTAYQAHAVGLGQAGRLRLGPYLLVDLLGEGGMGQVYKARDTRTGQLIAVKLIRSQLLDDADAVGRFTREVRAASRLDAHPHLVNVLDSGTHDGALFFVMEFIDGSDLSKWVKQHGPMPLPLAREVIRQAALGLQHASDKGLVHRDIKPANLLLSREGVVKVMDLGLARGDGEGHFTELTQTGAVMGTPDYISPEQAQSAKHVDIRSDLYSLGCTFYFLLTGRVPFPRDMAVKKLLAHMGEEPEPIRSLRPEVPPRLVGVVNRLMAKDPAYRFQTPADLVQALVDPALLDPNALLDNTITEPGAAGWSGLMLPSAATEVTREESSFRQERRWPWGWLLAGLAVTLVGVGLLTALLLGGRRPAAPPTAGEGVTAGVDVQAGGGWQDTGVSVAAGDTLSLTVIPGVWKSAAVPKGCAARGSEEANRDDNIVIDAPALCLVGRFGNGEPFALHTTRKLRGPAGGGRLFLRANTLEPSSASGTQRVEIEGGVRAGTPADPPSPTRVELAASAIERVLARSPEPRARAAFVAELRTLLYEQAISSRISRVASRLRAELGQLPSPLDALNSASIPAGERYPGLPAEVVGVRSSAPRP